MIVPKLRFSQFKDEWNESNVGSLISNSSEKFNPLKETVNLPCVELEHLSQGTGEIIGYCSSVKQKSIKNKFNEKNVLFGKLRPYLKKYAKPNFKGVCSSEIWVLSSQRLNTNLLFQYIQTRAFLDLTLIQSGSKMPRAEWEMVADGTIFYPQEKEQTKIAEFLSAVDDKISQLGRQLELLNQYKKGVMQKIFSQEIRFKNDNGEDFGEWEEIQLKEFLTLTLRPVDKPNKNYHALGVRSHFKGLFSKYDSQPEKNSMDVLYEVFENDIVVNITFAWEGAMAIANKIHHKGLVSHRFPTYQTDESKILLNFFRYRFIQKDFLAELQLCSPGGAGRNRVLSKKDFLEISILKPSVQEQTKIAEFLTAIDERIDHTTAQLTHTKQWKKGLLQQMFV